MNGEAKLVRPWFHRLVEWAPVSPVWFATGVAAGIALFHGGLLLALDGLNADIHWDSVPHRVFIFSSITGYALGVSYLGFRASLRDLDALRPLAVDDEVFDTLRRFYLLFPRRGLLLSSLLAPLMPAVLISIQGRTETMSLIDNGWHFVGMTLFGVVAWPALFLLIVAGRRFRSCGRRMVRIDLLDLEGLAPFSRVGLRASLGILASTPIVFLPIALAGATPSAWLASIVIFAPSALLAIIALVEPAWGIHRNLQESKALELERIRAAVAGDTSALRDSRLAPHAPSLSIVDLLSYRDRIEGLREWPFDTSTLRRFGLYLLIPPASWVAAALVERLVDLLVA